MRRYYLFSLLLLITCLFNVVDSYAQDVIELSDGSSITCKVLLVSDSEITIEQGYSKPKMKLPVNEIVKITYENGEVDYYSSPEQETTNNTAQKKAINTGLPTSDIRNSSNYAESKVSQREIASAPEKTLRDHNHEIEDYLVRNSIMVNNGTAFIYGDAVSLDNLTDISLSSLQSLVSARKYENDGSSKKALKIYRKLVEKENIHNAYTWFCYGRCCMDNKKWKYAVKAFKSVPEQKNCSDAIAKSSENMLARAEKERAAQIERRGELWGNIIGATILTGTQMYMAHEQSKMESNNQSQSSVSSSSGNMNYLLDPMYAVKQVEQQDRQEWLQARQFDPTLSFEQYRMIKYSSPSESNENSSSSDTGTSPGSYSTTSSHDCAYCHGTGKILHEKSIETYGVGYQRNGTCPECGATLSNTMSHAHVNCGHCGGSGKMRM